MKGMPQDDVDTRGDEITAYGHGLFAHPLGSEAHHRNVGEVVAEPSFQHHLVAASEPSVVDTASHVSTAACPRLAHLAKARSGLFERRFGSEHAGLSEAIAAHPVLSTSTSFAMELLGEPVG